MQWCDFYDAFWDWSDSTRRTRISSLEDVGSGDEVVEAVLEIEDPKVKAQLIRKAMKLGAEFSSDDFMNLDGELPDELYEQLGKYAGYDHKDPYFDEDNMTWDDFECCYSDWSEELTARRIAKLNDFGDPESVCEVIMCMPTSELEDALYKRAVKKGVKFTEEQLDNMGHIEFQVKKALDGFGTDEQVSQLQQKVDVLCKQLDEQYPEPAQQKQNQNKETAKGILGFLGMIVAAIFGVFAVFLGVIFGLTKKYDGGSHRHSSSWGSFGNHSKKKGSHCDGDCANCPAHYGYRYGRWYYGHGHQHGCVRGGNGGRRGLTLRD